MVGSLHVGDEILEINGTNVTNHSVDQLQKAMVGIHSALVLVNCGSELLSTYRIFLWMYLYLIEGPLITQEMTTLCFHLVNFQNKADDPECLERALYWVPEVLSL